MRKQILDALKAKFVGVSEQVLNRIADKLAKTVSSEEDVTTAVEGVTIQQVIESYGDSRATEAQKTAVHNYENKYGLKDGQVVKKIDEPKKNDGGNDEVPAWAQALIDSNKAMSDRLNKLDQERTTNNRKSALSAIVDKLPEQFRKGYARISVDSLTDEEFVELKTEIEAEVEAIAKTQREKGAFFGTPKGNGSVKQPEGKGATDDEVNAVVDRLNI